jgi:hypothetical protein
LGSFLLFVTNVIAILASGIVVMALYRVRQTSDQTASMFFSAIPGLVVGLLLLAVIVPLWVNSQHYDRSSIRLTGVQAVADHWATAAGWAVLGVSNIGSDVLVDVTGPSPAPSLVDLRRQLDSAGLGGFEVRVQVLTGRYVPLPK